MPFPDFRIPQCFRSQSTYTGPSIKRCPLLYTQIHDTPLSTAKTISPPAISAYITAQLAAMQRNSYHFIAVDVLGRSSLPSAVFRGLMYLPKPALDEQMAILLHNTRISLLFQFENMSAVVMMAEDACESVREQMARARKMGVWLGRVEREGGGWWEVYAKGEKKRNKKGEGNQTSANWCAGWLDGIRVRGHQDEGGRRREVTERGTQTEVEEHVLFPLLSAIGEEDENESKTQELRAGSGASKEERPEDEELEKRQSTMEDSSSEASPNSSSAVPEDAVSFVVRPGVAQALVRLGEFLVERHQQHKMTKAGVDFEVVLGDAESAELIHLGEFLARLRR